MSLTRAGVSLSLPTDFRVVAAQDGQLLDLPEEAPLDPAAQAWLSSVRAAFASAGALLCAVHVESWRGVPASASLVLACRPLHDEHEVSLLGLRSLAVARTSAGGQVSVLDLPVGRAIGTVDVLSLALDGGETAPAAVGLVEVQLPLPALDCLLSLTLCTPVPELLGAYAALVAEVAHRLELEPGAPP